MSDVTDDKLTLVHVVHRIELNRVNDANMQLRTVALLEEVVSAYLSLVSFLCISLYIFVFSVVKFELFHFGYFKENFNVLGVSLGIIFIIKGFNLINVIIIVLETFFYCTGKFSKVSSN